MIHSATVGTPLGAILIAGRVDAVTSIRFLDRAADLSPANEDGAVARAARQLEEYFSGRRTVFDVPLDKGDCEVKAEMLNAAGKVLAGGYYVYCTKR